MSNIRWGGLGVCSWKCMGGRDLTREGRPGMAFQRAGIDAEVQGGGAGDGGADA